LLDRAGYSKLEKKAVVVADAEKVIRELNRRKAEALEATVIAEITDETNAMVDEIRESAYQEAGFLNMAGEEHDFVETEGGTHEDDSDSVSRDI
jgi:hypothetical protein